MDELTTRANEDLFSRLRLLPRVLQGSGTRTLASVLAGTPASCPVLVVCRGVTPAITAFPMLARILSPIPD